ncbi:Protein of unknown function [Gryllus bimaculatus]|nr:Protein of unknown function [Gryllus bimaculatus]
MLKSSHVFICGRATRPGRFYLPPGGSTGRPLVPRSSTGRPVHAVAYPRYVGAILLYACCIKLYYLFTLMRCWWCNATGELMRSSAPPIPALRPPYPRRSARARLRASLLAALSGTRRRLELFGPSLLAESALAREPRSARFERACCGALEPCPRPGGPSRSEMECPRAGHWGRGVGTGEGAGSDCRLFGDWGRIRAEGAHVGCLPLPSDALSSDECGSGEATGCPGQTNQQRSSCIANALQWTDVAQSLNRRVVRGVITNPPPPHITDPVEFLNRCRVPFHYKMFEELNNALDRPSFKIFAQLECQFLIEKENVETHEILGVLQPIFLSARTAVLS